MAVINTALVTIKIRHDQAGNWTLKNPILQVGEYGYEEDTFLLKIGDGSTSWNNLPYLNKVNNTYFEKGENGELTFSQSFKNLITEIINKQTTTDKLTIINDPIDLTDATNKKYVDLAIENAGHLKKQVVNSLNEIVNPDNDTIYLLRNNNNYIEYYVVNNQLTHIGSVPIANSNTLGGVLSSTEDNFIQVTQSGFMTLNRVSTSLLYVPDGDTLVINGGNA